MPDGTRGTVRDGYIHLADWYATFCHLAGADAADARAAKAGLPPVDSMDMWPGNQFIISLATKNLLENTDGGSGHPISVPSARRPATFCLC